MNNTRNMWKEKNSNTCNSGLRFNYFRCICIVRLGVRYVH